MVNKIKKLNEMGLSFATIAKGIGVSKQAISFWINGARYPSHENEIKFDDWLQKLKKEVANL